MRWNTVLFVAAAALVGMGARALAQGTSGSAASALDTLVVTASRFAEEKREVTSNISVIDRDFIANSNASDLADILAAYGLEISSDHGMLSGISIRGFSTEAHGFELGGQVTVLVDGRRSMTGNVAKMVPSSIERVEIIRGPVAAQYGPSAMGGIVNVITRRGEGQKPFGVEARAGLGSYGLRDAGVTFSGERQGFDYFASVDWSSRDDLHLPDGSVYASTRWSKRLATTLNLGYTFGRHRIGFSGTVFDGDTNFAGPINNIRPRHSDRINRFGEISYQGATEDGRFSWSARYGMGKDDENYIGLVATSFSRYWTDARTGSGQVTYDSGMLALSVGVDYALYEMERTWAPFASDSTDTAIFGLGKLRLLGDALVFSFGGRYDWFELSEKDSPQGHSVSDKNFSPTVGVAWLPAPWLKLRAHFAEAFLMPSQSQLFSDSGTYVGNPDLKPETSLTWEFGADVSWQELNFSATFFRTDSKDLIITGRADDGRNTYVNVGRALREGLEFELNANLGPRLLGEGYYLRPYVNLNVMTKFIDKDTGEKLYNIGEITAGYGVSFATPGNDFSASVRARYLGRKTYRTSTTNAVFGKYTVVDVTLSKKLADLGAGGSITLKAAVNNVTNQYYETYYAYPQPGRNFYVGLAYSY
ncbi:MAG: TonB-dependent receptor [Deltaproteobacteria bacterium]|jgi:vitamin B12 transporter|nr:TonB-dependent receptor [Deltaproteobacteria bacterium]